MRTPRSTWVLPTIGALLYFAILPIQIGHGSYYCTVARARGLDDVCDAPAYVMAGLTMLWLVAMPAFAAVLWFCLRDYRGGKSIFVHDISAESVASALASAICFAFGVVGAVRPNGDHMNNPWGYAFILYWVLLGIWWFFVHAAAVHHSEDDAGIDASG